MAGFNIRATLGLNTTGFNRGLRRSKKQLTTFQSALKGTSNMVKGMLSAFAVGAILTQLRSLVTTTSDFADAMARVKVISQANAKQFAMMEKEARRLGATTRFSAVEAAQGFQFLTMAGLSSEQAMEALGSTLDLAGAAMVDVGYAADVTTNLISGFGLQVSDTKKVVDLLAHTTRSSNTNLEELYDGMKEAAPMATQLGISIDEVATSMALFANSGIKGQRAGVAFSGVMARLLRQPKEVADSLQDLGVEINEATIRNEGFLNTMIKLNQAGINATQMTKIFGLHVKTAGIFAGKTATEIHIMSELLEDYNNAASDMSTEGLGEYTKAVKQLSSSWDELLISFGKSGAIDAVTSLVDGLKHVIQNIDTIIEKWIYLTGFIPIIGPLINKYLDWGYNEAYPAALQWLADLGNDNQAEEKVGGISKAVAGLSSEFDGLSSANLTAEEAQKRLNDALKKYQDLSIEDKERVRLELIKEQVRELGREEAYLKNIASNFKRAGGVEGDSIASVLGVSAKEDFDATLLKINKLKATIKALKGETTIGAESALPELPDHVAEAWAELNEMAVQGTKQALAEVEAEYTKAMIEVNRIIESYAPDEGFKLLSGDEAKAASKALERFKEETIAKTKATEELLEIEQERAEFIQGQYIRIFYELGGALSSLDLTDKEQAWVNFVQVVAREAQKLSGILAQALKLETAYTVAKGKLTTKQVIMDTAKSASKGASDTAQIPFGYLAIPAVIASVIAMFAAIPKFETGGIVGGSSFSGDNIMARVNSGEMILNGSQQANLFRMANGTSGGLREVEFKIKGDTLVGALNNSKKKMSKFGG